MEDLEKQLSYYKSKLKVLREQRDGDINSMLHTMFRDIIEQGDKIEIQYNNAIKFKRFDGNYYKEMFGVYVGVSDILSSSPNKYFEPRNTHISYYMTTATDEYEFNRLITLGKVAEFVRDNTDLLVDELNEIIEKYEEELDELQAKVFDIKEKLAEAKAQKRNEEMQIMYAKAKADGGIDVSEGENGIRFWRTQNDEIRRVINFEIIDESESGKTFTVKLTRLLSNHFNDDTKEETQTIQARKEFVDRFLQNQLYNE